MSTLDSQNDASEINQSKRNATFASPMVSIRREIADLWNQVSSLLTELHIHQKTRLTTKILECRAISSEIDGEMRRILGQENLPVCAESFKLHAVCTRIDGMITLLQQQRDLLFTENPNIFGGYLAHVYYGKLYNASLDYEKRKSIALLGSLHAMDTFDPAKGELTTHAYSQIRRLMQRASHEERKHRAHSLDGGPVGNEIVWISSAKAADRNADGAFLVKKMQEALAELSPQRRRALELCSEFSSGEIYDFKDAAIIMLEEGLTSENGGTITGSKVDQWVRAGKQHIYKKMKKYYEPEKRSEE